MEQSLSKNHQVVVGILGFVIMTTLLIKDAYAYIDAGSGSVVIQMLIGTLVGIGVTLKLYWYKIKEKMSSTFSKQKD